MTRDRRMLERLLCSSSRTPSSPGSVKRDLRRDLRRSDTALLLGLATVALLALSALLVCAAGERQRVLTALVSAPWLVYRQQHHRDSSTADQGPKGRYLAQTLRSLRHDLQAKEKHSRNLRQQLKAVFHPDSFAPREPWQHAHSGKTAQYGSDFLQKGQLFLKSPL